ncbi:hypothetical protein [Stenotrophomonas maltophilia]|uniref:hypothetical protein n=1 Tax=Stenotrophomonas maltophilia TaxID=40324 RepID=UPI002553D84A|nr:hypothetical protein [Stenotrophomonas maltophilia]
MDFIDALSPCWFLSASCAPKWDAWSVAVAALAGLVALLAFGASVFLGVMTLRLGEAANRATAAALTVAEAEATARRTAEQDERLLILIWITHEVSIVDARAKRVLDGLDAGWNKFSSDGVLRAWTFEGMRQFGFPVCTSFKDRLHLLGQPLAGKLARAMGMGRSLDSFAYDYTSSQKEERYDQFVTMMARLSGIRCDLETVIAECRKAGEVAGKLKVTVRVG